MRMPWNKLNVEQLDLVDEPNARPSDSAIPQDVETQISTQAPSLDALAGEGMPLLMPVECLEEDPANPRTEFPDDEIAELAHDVALRGILQPIVVRRSAELGRYRVLFGAKRLRAAKRAALTVVPVVIGSGGHDVYAQVAENQKRHGLSPLDLARFMRSRADAGESNAEIARRMGIDLTSVAHHLALLTLPPELEAALRSGRCTSPRTLYELRKLHEQQPERVKAIAAGDSAITRTSVATLKTRRRPSKTPARRCAGSPGKPLVDQAHSLCTRLESLLAQMSSRGPAAADDLASVRRRLADLAGK